MLGKPVIFFFSFVRLSRVDNMKNVLSLEPIPENPKYIEKEPTNAEVGTCVSCLKFIQLSRLLITKMRCTKQKYAISVLI